MKTDYELDVLIRAARTRAAMDFPYFSQAIFASSIRPTDNFEFLAAVDHRANIYLGVKKLQRLRALVDEAKFIQLLSVILIHEVCHILRRHSERFEALCKGKSSSKFSEKAFNIAADCEINSHLCFQGMPSEFAPVEPKLFGLPDAELAEWYYNQLTKQQIDAIADFHEGSGVAGVKGEWEASCGNQGDGLSTGDLENLRRDVISDIKTFHRHQGSLPGLAARMLQSPIENRSDINWRSQLRRMIRATALSNDRLEEDSFSRPSRKNAIVYPAILPTSICRGNRYHISIVVDTSGSMDQTLLAKACREIVAIASTVTFLIELVPTDTQAYGPFQLHSGSAVDLLRQLKPLLIGGGGTSMTTGIDAAMRLIPFASFPKTIIQAKSSAVAYSNRFRPNQIVVLTDGFTKFPTEKKCIPVLWGIIGRNQVALPRPWTERDIVRITN